MLATIYCSTAFTSGSALRQQHMLPMRSVRAADFAISLNEESTVFKTPKATDDYMTDQLQRVAESGLTPKEYEESTRRTANEYLSTAGPHRSGDGAGSPQSAGFLKQLWDVDTIPAVPEAVSGDESNVLATIYEIGGPLTGILSTSVAKKLPLIPHIGIRVYGKEYFYSDHIEYRSVPVMEEMLGDMPRVSLDLGKCTLSPEEVQRIVDEDLVADWTADDYHVFDKNCVHFADALSARCTQDGIPRPLLQGVLDVSERMLDSLPEWRMKLGRRVMNEVTRLVVVSWGRASKENKEKAADKLGLDRGE